MGMVLGTKSRKGRTISKIRRSWTESNKYNETHKVNADIASGSWTFYGPSTSAGGNEGLGRINCIAFHPSLPNTYWAGTPAGGLWKTTDNGNTWTTNTDNLPVLGISDIAIDPTNASIMYVATGDGDVANSLQNGAGDTKSIGVLKSTNGGSTWSTTGLNWNVSTQGLIRRLLINPNNTQILLAATSNGIYRTINGGTTWTSQQIGWFIDMELKPTDPNYVYATTFDSGGNAQIFRSINNGVSWTQVTSFTGYNRINIAVSANQVGLVDAVCSNSSGANSNGLGGLWYSSNSGALFTQYFSANCTNNMLHENYTGTGCKGQGFYDLAYAINPSDASEIWLGGTNTWRTTDAGTNWNLNNVWTASYTTAVPEVHADKHFIAFHPLNNSYVFECNDGGLYETNDAGATWYDITDGMGISEIYRIGTSATIQNNVICGLQDNGSKELYNSTWYQRKGGDGMECIIDFTNANIEYASYVQGQISKSTDGGNNWNIIVQNNSTGVHGPGEWVTPYLMNPTNNNILIVGKSQVYQTSNGGTTWSQLGTISGASGNIISMAYAPSNTQIIYVATSDQMYKTINGGTTWTLIGTSTERITYIAVSQTNSQVLWETNSGYGAGDKVWKSINGGTSWTNYSGTLPNIPVNCIVYENGSNDGLYIGTDVGVYYRNATMSDWVIFNTGLPNVVVNELEISYNNSKIWAATFGRGLWRSDLFGVFTGQNATNISSDQINIFPNPSQGHFTIQTETSFDNAELTIFNVIGENIYQGKLSFKTAEIDLSSQSGGVYFISIKTGSQSINRKIIIE